MALIYALLAVCAVFLAAAYRWRYALIPAFVCVGIVAFLSGEQHEPVSAQEPQESENDRVSMDNLPPFVEVIKTQHLQNGAEVVLLRKNVIIQPLQDDEYMVMEVEGTCAIYNNQSRGIVTDLGC